MEKFKSILLGSLGGLFIFWVFYRRLFGLRPPMVIAEMNLSQGLFCAILMVCFLIPLIVLYKQLYELYVVYFFGYSNYFGSSKNTRIKLYLKPIFEKIRDMVMIVVMWFQQSLLNFYRFFFNYFPNYTNIFLFFIKKMVNFLSNKRIRLLILLCDAL